jgi:hypothetical protein
MAEGGAGVALDELEMTCGIAVGIVSNVGATEPSHPHASA